MIETAVKVLVFGAVVGGIWALVASGFSLIFGVLRILNFAHGAAFVTAAYAAFALSSKLGLPAAVIVGILLAALIGLAVYLITKPVRKNEVMVIILTLAFALMVQQILLVNFGDRGVQVIPFVEGVVEFAGVKVTYIRLLSLILAVLCILALEVFVSRTKLGKKVMATAQDGEAAMMVGIDVEKIYVLVMVISAILAGFAGILYAQIFAVNPETSLRALIYAFAIVILGGLGSLRGSIIASFIVGYIIVLTINFLDARWSEFVMLLAIVAILIVKPTGLFGVEG